MEDPVGDVSPNRGVTEPLIPKTSAGKFSKSLFSGVTVRLENTGNLGSFKVKTVAEGEFNVAFVSEGKEVFARDKDLKDRGYDLSTTGQLNDVTSIAQFILDRESAIKKLKTDLKKTAFGVLVKNWGIASRA